MALDDEDGGAGSDVAEDDDMVGSIGNERQALFAELAKLGQEVEGEQKVEVDGLKKEVEEGRYKEGLGLDKVGYRPKKKRGLEEAEGKLTVARSGKVFNPYGMPDSGF